MDSYHPIDSDSSFPSIFVTTYLLGDHAPWPLGLFLCFRSHSEIINKHHKWATTLKQESHVMRKPAFAICEQQRRRSACTSAQSDQHLCCSLPRQYNTSSFYIWSFKPLASFCSWADWFESYLVANPEDRFSHDVAQELIKIYSPLVNVAIMLHFLFLSC